MDLKTRFAIGVDLGGTKIDIGLVDETGHILQHKRVETPVAEGAKAIENLILDSIRTLQKEAPFPLLGIGIGVAGQIDRESGDVIFAPNLKWHQVPLRKNLEAVLGLPVRIINDARALTLGEWEYGAGKGLQDILCLFIGTGIGAGIVSGGTLLCGCSNTFGEVGHMTIDFNGPVCTCGNRGCFEAFCGGWGIAARAKDAMKKMGTGAQTQKIIELAGNNIDKVTAYHVLQAFRQNDPFAQHLIEQMLKALIPACASLVNVFNTERTGLGVELDIEAIERANELYETMGLGSRDDAAAMQYLIPGWKFDPKRPCLVR